MKKITYPTPERIIEYNLLVLTVIKIKKADKPEVLNKQKIIDIIGECEKLEGDIYDKAVFLLKSLIQKHPFASETGELHSLLQRISCLEIGQNLG